MKCLVRGGIIGLAAWLSAGTGAFAGAMEDGQNAYLKKDYPASYDSFSKAFRENPDNPEAAVGLGLAAEALGFYDRSQFMFERALTLNPGNHPARLELARTYLAMGMPEVARQEYQRLLESDPPEAIRQQIEREMDQAALLQTRFFSSAKMTVEGLYDSNVQFGPTKDFVDTQLGTLSIADESKPKAAAGGAISLSGDSLYDFGARGGWSAIAGAGTYIESLPGESEYAAQDFNAYAGVRRTTSATLLDFPLKARYFMMDWDRLVTIGGFDPVFGWALSDRWRLYTAAGIEGRDYADDPRDSLYVELSETARRYFGAASDSSLSLKAGVFREDSDLGGYDCGGLEFALNGEKRFPWGLTAAAGIGCQAVRYDEILYSLLQEEAREDFQWNGSASLSKALTEHSLASLSWSYEETDSNFDLYSYRRHEVRLGATVWF